jgi:hypothetical protein
MAMGFAALAQSPKARVEAQRTADNNEQRPARSTSILSTYSGTETVVWSEDFANGIPATWTNTGGLANNLPDPDSKWEYRGPSTTPNYLVGSRGAYGNPAFNITSPTASNGFMIFDSDYLDNNGVAGGTGPATAPHVAGLVTGTINLAGLSNLDLKFFQYYRKYWGPSGNSSTSATFVDFSIDGGVTFPYSVALNTTMAVNTSTLRNDVVAVPIPSSVAGQANVKIRFRWDGDYYYWMIDDIQIVATPKHRLEFTTSNGAPKVDILYGPASGSSKLGNMSLKQNRSITFDANVYNTGLLPQTAVKLRVQVLNSTGAVIQTLNGPTRAIVAVGDTADYNDLNTSSTAWTPAAVGTYGIVYSVVSDSAVAVFPDTMAVTVTNDYNSLDFSRFSNSWGTPNIGLDGSAFAARHDFLNAERLFGVNVGLSALTTSGGIVEMSVFDSSAYIGQTAGFDQNSILAYSQATITATDTAAGTIYFDLTDPITGYPILLPQGSYYFVFTMYSNNGADVIRIRNDDSFENANGSALMYLTTVNGTVVNTWYSGYSGGSRSFENPWIRSKTCESANPVACMGIGLTEEAMASITVAPVPANEVLNVAFGAADGQFTLTLIDVTGKLVKSRNVVAEAGTAAPLYVGDLAAGMYTLTVSNGAQVKTLKVAIQ